MTASTDAVRAFCVQLACALDDDKVALAGGAQSSSPRLMTEASRFTKVTTAADSAQLPSILSGEAQGISRIVVNDSANAMAVFPAAGETINAGAANASISVPAGQSCLFVHPAPASSGGATALPTNWRAAVIP